MFSLLYVIAVGLGVISLINRWIKRMTVRRPSLLSTVMVEKLTTELALYGKRTASVLCARRACSLR